MAAGRSLSTVWPPAFAPPASFAIRHQRQQMLGTAAIFEAVVSSQDIVSSRTRHQGSQGSVVPLRSMGSAQSTQRCVCTLHSHVVCPLHYCCSSLQQRQCQCHAQPRHIGLNCSSHAASARQIGTPLYSASWMIHATLYPMGLQCCKTRLAIQMHGVHVVTSQVTVID